MCEVGVSGVSGRESLELRGSVRGEWVKDFIFEGMVKFRVEGQLKFRIQGSRLQLIGSEV